MIVVLLLFLLSIRTTDISLLLGISPLLAFTSLLEESFHTRHSLAAEGTMKEIMTNIIALVWSESVQIKIMTKKTGIMQISFCDTSKYGTVKMKNYHTTNN